MKFYFLPHIYFVGGGGGGGGICLGLPIQGLDPDVTTVLVCLDRGRIQEVQLSERHTFLLFRRDGVGRVRAVWLSARAREREKDRKQSEETGSGGQFQRVRSAGDVLLCSQI